MIPGCPNGETRPAATPVIRFARKRTRGTETSQYPEEEKSTEITEVAASEPVPAQTSLLRGTGVVGPTDGSREVSRSPLERGARDGDSPVDDDEVRDLVEFLSNARHEKPGVKLGGPPSKAKDSRVTDSERVP